MTRNVWQLITVCILILLLLLVFMPMHLYLYMYIYIYTHVSHMPVYANIILGVAYSECMDQVSTLHSRFDVPPRSRLGFGGRSTPACGTYRVSWIGASKMHDHA